MRVILKSLLRSCFRLLVLPAVLVYRLHAAISGSDEAFPGWSQLFSLLPGRSGEFLRHAFYRSALAGCGDNACVSFGTVFAHPEASLGRHVYIGNHCCIGNVTIEDDVLIASRVSIMNGCHQHQIGRLDRPVREQSGTFAPVTIGQDSWIGEAAVIAADVGRHCVVGAGALVLKPLPDYAIAVGSPARIIGDRRAQRNTESGVQKTESAQSIAIGSR